MRKACFFFGIVIRKKCIAWRTKWLYLLERVSLMQIQHLALCALLPVSLICFLDFLDNYCFLFLILIYLS